MTIKVHKTCRHSNKYNVMCDGCILDRATDKALKNGYRFPLLEKNLLYAPRNFGKNTVSDLIVRGIIFSHDFAKAFWGDYTTRYCEEKCKQFEGIHLTRVGHWHHGWEHHLQSMVLVADPIKYLEKFL